MLSPELAYIVSSASELDNPFEAVVSAMATIAVSNVIKVVGAGMEVVEGNP